MRRSLHLPSAGPRAEALLPPRGDHYDLEVLFDELNLRFFQGLGGSALLGWSRVFRGRR